MKRFDEAHELKHELEEKEQDLKRLQENDRKIRHRLRAAKKKEKDLETELKKMPIGVVLKGDSKTLELMKSGKKWHISCYPQLFNTLDYMQWKGSVVPAICCLCRGLISRGTNLRIPSCDHTYHVCWEESWRETIALAWVKKFSLDREVNLQSLKQRYYCSWGVRSMPPSQYANIDDNWELTGLPTMCALKKEYLQELSDGLSEKIVVAIRGLKFARRVHYFRPTHIVHGAQFRLWSPVNIGVQALCDLNTALCIRLRPWDGIFLEHFAPTILVLPCVGDKLRMLLEKKIVSVWVIDHVTLEALKCKDTYRTDEQFEVLSSLFF
ncbi:hypothetical protein R1sor_005608 [Riccia sorocarpa]|uniref:Uncharacterized protein n=1 Tax=Riccia sorocarpa TaxID=122646 RepID=A0ABD3HN09_9MARC